jgi:hypothetical protein
MPICPQCRNGYDADQERCPKCGTARPIPLPPEEKKKEDYTTIYQPYGGFALFCLRCSQIFGFIGIFGSVYACYISFKTQSVWFILLSLFSIPAAIGYYIAMKIAIAFAQKENHK